MGGNPGGRNIEPDESLMRGYDLKGGRLGDDGGISLKSDRD